MTQESLIEGIFRSLKKKAGWAVIIVGLAVVGAVFINRYFPPVYESQSLLRVMTTEDTAGLSLAASMNGILAQKSVISKALKSCNLPADEARNEELYALEDAGPGLVKMLIRHENPAILKELGNSMIKVLSNEFLSYSSEKRSFELKALEKKREHLEKQLAETRNTLARTSAVATVHVDSKTLLLENELHQLEEKIDNNQKKLQTIPEVTYFSIIEESPEYSRYSNELGKYQNQLAELFKSYKEKHPKVVAVRKKINRCEKRLAQAKTQKRKKKSNPEYISLRAEIESDINKIALLKENLEKFKEAEKFQISQSEQALQHLSLRLKTLDEIHQKTTLEIEEAKIRQNTTYGKINVLRKDRQHPSPIGFSAIQRDCIALASGVLMAVFMLYSPQPVRTEIVSVNAEMLASGGYVANQALIRAEPIETILQVPLLAPERLALPAPEEFGSEESIFDERLIALNEPDSPKMGPYKSLLSNLQVSIADSHTRIVLVGSSRNQSGKTTLLANTSILLAQAGYSVLMIDANFRNPALHKVFDLQNKVGLSDGLKGANSTMLMQKTCVKNLSLISTGTTPTNPTEFLGSPEMIELLAELKRKVEVILIDTPALLEFPDAGVLAGHTGGIVFLHNENEESEDDIRSSKKLLKKIRARILGYVTV